MPKLEERGEETLSVWLEKGKKRYGLAYRATATQGLLITGILPGSAVDDWNRHCEAEQMICVGDEILAVNGQQRPRAMLEELIQSSSATISLRMAGPRWHIFDDRLSNMEKDLQVAKAPERRASLSTIELATRQLDGRGLILLFSLTALPSAVMLTLFSDMGFGLEVYSFFAPWYYDYLGNAVAGIACLVGVVLYVFDWSQWQSLWLKVATGLVTIYMLSFGFLLKSQKYPQAPLVVCLFHLPAFLGVLRVKILRRVRRSDFYLGTALCTGLVACAVLAMWLLWMYLDSLGGINAYDDGTKARLVRDSVRMYEAKQIEIAGRERPLDYDWDCSKQKRDFDFRIRGTEKEPWGEKLSSDAKMERASACAQINTIWFLVYVAPFICIMVNAVISVFCLVNGVWLNVDDASKLERVLKHFILLIAMVLLAMWVSASIAGTSMRLTGTLMAFWGATLVALFIWIYLEVSRQAITSAVHNSKMMRSLIRLATSDWARAMLILCSFGVLVPAFLLINMLNQKVRKVRGLSQSNLWFTEGSQKVIEGLARWKWSSILVKANALAILYWSVSILVAKMTYVFLSWLNEALLKVNLVPVIVIFFMIGYFLFLLPPVPGIPVYVCSGIILAARCRNIEGIGYWGGTAIGLTLSMVLKLAAVCGQYMIGYFLGKSVKVQQLVGVDKIFTRGVERILGQRGMGVSKVSVLVGGPDWPTSVMCGILRLNLPQCVLGTLPVLMVIAPCVFTGAFLAGGPGAADSSDSSGEGNLWSTLATTMTLVSGLFQLGSGSIALYFIQDVVNRHSEELARHRPEHEPVAALTQKEMAYTQAYEEATDWGTLRFSRRLLLLSATTMMLLSFFIFMFLDEVCFRNFKVDDSISAPYEENGLNGNAMSIILMPGWGALALFFLACFLHCVFLRASAVEAARRLKERELADAVS